MSRIQHLSRVDDIRPRILNESSDLEMWTQVEPAMFEPVILEELVKYERYKQEVSNLEGTVAKMLSDLEVCCVSFGLALSD
jgi:programmed cell death 6-interacting protein